MSDVQSSDEWIDIHAHIGGFAPFGIDPEVHGAVQGVGVLVDAGSAPPAQLETLLRASAVGQTKILAWANICAEGIAGEGCASHDISGRDADAALAANPGAVVGIKLQASTTRLAARAIPALRQALSIAGAHRVPVLVHVGNAPPLMYEVLELLRPGDILTHFAHGKPGGALDERGCVHPSLSAARARGVLFDLGHGAASFSFAVMEQLLAQGFAPDIISTDLHRGSVARPVGSLADCMSKMLGLGMPQEAVLAAVTATPREALRLPASSRKTVFRLVDEPWLAEDSYGSTRQLSCRFVPATLVEDA